MRIHCPACNAAYDVPEALLAAGKPVRCAKCGAIWTPEFPPPSEPAPGPAREPALRAPAPPEPAPAEPPSRPRLPSLRTPEPAAGAEDERLPPQNYEDFSRAGRGALLGWAVSLIVLIALGVAAVGWRDAVMAAWPASERLYAALGLR
jgi:predicted Zn finger-like uncharacterized protein